MTPFDGPWRRKSWVPDHEEAAVQFRRLRESGQGKQTP